MQCSQSSDQGRRKISTLSITKPIRNTVKHYFHCIAISQSWNTHILLYFTLMFSQCSTSIYQAFDGYSNLHKYLTLRFYHTHSQKFDACEKYVFYSIL